MSMDHKTGNEMEDFDDEELTELYSWIDSIPLSRPKKNIAQDFSDGVLVAELIKHCCSVKGLVDLHNYSKVNNTRQKEGNWRLMNRKVFKKLNFQLAEDVIHDLSAGKPGVIEKFLMMLRVKLNRAEWELKKNPPKAKGGGKKESDKPEADQYMGSPRGKAINKKQDPSKGGYPYFYRDPRLELITLFDLDSSSYPAGIPKHKVIQSIAESNNVPRAMYEEKEEECLAKDERIRILQAKIERMEQLIHLKDVRIDDLQSKIEEFRPTGFFVK